VHGRKDGILGCAQNDGGAGVRFETRGSEKERLHGFDKHYEASGLLLAAQAGMNGAGS